MSRLPDEPSSYLCPDPEVVALIGEGSEDSKFQCEQGCGQTLVDRYIADCLIDVGIRCPSCGHISRTPNIPEGEVFPHHILAFGEEKKYRLSGSVNVPAHALLTTNAALAEAHNATAPRHLQRKFAISAGWVDGLIAEYETSTGTDFYRQLRQTARKPNQPLRFPFVWAADFLRERLSGDEPLYLSQRSVKYAFFVLLTYEKTISSWSHHPRFAAVINGVGKADSFIHTTFQLAAAHYLYDSGNRIGLSLEDKFGQPNPDLYFRSNARTNHFIEVKAPQGLQYQPGIDCYPDVEKIVHKTIKRSGHQINRNFKGILALANSLHHPWLRNDLVAAVRKELARKGRDHSGLERVVVLSAEDVVFSIGSKAGALEARTGIRNDPIYNPHFAGYFGG